MLNINFIKVFHCFYYLHKSSNPLSPSILMKNCNQGLPNRAVPNWTGGQQAQFGVAAGPVPKISSPV